MKDNQKKMLAKALKREILESLLSGTPTSTGNIIFSKSLNLGNFTAFDDFRKLANLSKDLDEMLLNSCSAYLDEIVDVLVDFDLLKIDL